VILDHYGDVLAASGEPARARAAWVQAAAIRPDLPGLAAKLPEGGAPR
jgi:hypothetical protein